MSLFLFFSFTFSPFFSPFPPPPLPQVHCFFKSSLWFLIHWSDPLTGKQKVFFILSAPTSSTERCSKSSNATLFLLYGNSSAVAWNAQRLEKWKTWERTKTAITESESHRRKHHIHATKHNSIYNTYCSFGHIWLESGPIRMVNEARIYAQSRRQMDVKTESDGSFCSVVPLVGDLTGREWERSKKPHLKSSQPCQPCQLHHN